MRRGEGVMDSQEGEARRTESHTREVYGWIYASYLLGSVAAAQLRGSFSGSRSSVTVSRYAMTVASRATGRVHEDAPDALFVK